MPVNPRSEIDCTDSRENRACRHGRISSRVRRSCGTPSRDVICGRHRPHAPIAGHCRLPWCRPGSGESAFTSGLGHVEIRLNFQVEKDRSTCRATESGHLTSLLSGRAGTARFAESRQGLGGAGESAASSAVTRVSRCGRIGFETECAARCRRPDGPQIRQVFRQSTFHGFVEKALAKQGVQ